MGKRISRTGDWSGPERWHRSKAFGLEIDLDLDCDDLVRLGRALHDMGEGRLADKAMKAGLSEGRRKLQARTKRMLQGLTGIKLQRRITKSMKPIGVRRTSDGQGWETGLTVFDRHSRITAEYYSARWSRKLPGVHHHAWGRKQIADGAFMIPGVKPAFKRIDEKHQSRRGRFEQKLKPLWGPSMAREMDRNEAKVRHIAKRIVKFNVQPTIKRMLHAGIVHVKHKHGL